MPMRNGLKTIAFMTCLAMALHLPGCAFSQWTEHYYFGDYLHKPVYRDHVATGVAILPFALVGDVVTAPIQLLLLVFKGDDFLYRKSSVVSRDFFTTRETRTDAGLAELSPGQRSELEATVASEMDGLDGSSSRDKFSPVAAAPSESVTSPSPNDRSRPASSFPPVV